MMATPSHGLLSSSPSHNAEGPIASYQRCTEGESSCQQQQQQQHDAPIVHSSTVTACCGASDDAWSWQITDFGQVPEFSRDGSIHATDEVFNSASHLVAALLSLLGTVLLIVESAAMGSPWKIVCFSIYGASLICLFTMSTLHHAISTSSKIEEFLRMMDYLAIYPLIAGTFTPLCLVFFHKDPIGWSFCGTVWFVAIMAMIGTGVCFKKVPKWLSMTLYITLGWFGACMAYWLVQVLGISGFLWFLAGGVLYTVGGVIYSMEQPNPWPGQFGFHEIWHVAVVLAAACHWFLMYFYVLPWEESGNSGDFRVR